METSLGSFVGSFLQCVTEEPPTQQQIDVLMVVARRADFERLTKGDFVIPLNSPKLKEAVGSTTPLGSFLLHPSDNNTKLLERALEGCKVPVSCVVVQSNMLRIYLDKAKVMKASIPIIAKKGQQYGASHLLQQVPVLVSHYITQEGSYTLKTMRGVKLTNHIAKVMEFCGAKVKVKEIHRTVVRSSNTHDPIVADQEDCEPRSGCTVTSEPHDHSLNPNAHTETSPSCDNPSVVNERQCNEVSVFGEESQVNHRKQCIETDLEAASNRERESAVTDTTKEMICVVRVPENQQTRTDTQTSCRSVCEGTKSPVKDENKKMDNISQDIPVLPKDEMMSRIEFLVTDSMKGVPNGPWVYQYGSVVDAKTGKAWTGSVQDYCRIVEEELKQTSKMRQKEEEEEEVEVFLEKQVQRCLTLHILSPTHSNQLRVEVEGDTHNTKEVAFMLYNYARLCSILDHFDQCVHQGDVSPLPPVEDVDFSLLKTDEEWDLVWLYLLRWPDLVEETAAGVLAGTRKPKTTHVSRFLYSLSHRWSEYYGRYQVLSEGFLPHLLPLMYARLHLLHALATLMRVGFGILGVDSLPAQM